MGPGSAIVCEFTTSSPTTGAATSADSLPTATLARNGVDAGAVPLTVASIDTARYRVTGTVPSTYAYGDVLEVAATATVGGITGKEIVFRTELAQTTIYGESGTVAWPITIYDTDGVTPLPGVAVYVSSDLQGLHRSEEQTTGATGRIQFDLDPGTIYVWPKKAGVLFAAAPYQETVSAGGAGTITLPDPDVLAAGQIPWPITIYAPGGVTPLPNVSVWVSSDVLGLHRSAAKTTDALGKVVFNLNPGTIYVWPSGGGGLFAGAPYQETVA